MSRMQYHAEGDAATRKFLTGPNAVLLQQIKRNPSYLLKLSDAALVEVAKYMREMEPRSIEDEEDTREVQAIMQELAGEYDVNED